MGKGNETVHECANARPYSFIREEFVDGLCGETVHECANTRPYSFIREEFVDGLCGKTVHEYPSGTMYGHEHPPVFVYA